MLRALWSKVTSGQSPGSPAKLKRRRPASSSTASLAGPAPAPVRGANSSTVRQCSGSASLCLPPLHVSVVSLTGAAQLQISNLSLELPLQRAPEKYYLTLPLAQLHEVRTRSFLALFVCSALTG